MKKYKTLSVVISMVIILMTIYNPANAISLSCVEDHFSRLNFSEFSATATPQSLTRQLPLHRGAFSILAKI